MCDRFGEGPLLPPPPSIRGGLIESPIPEEEAGGMSDEEWLEAVARYWKDSGDDFLEGGAHQLSGVLEAQAKEDPERFARLALRFPNDTHRYYFDSILRAVADVGVGTETLLELCRKCHGLPDRPCGPWLCGAVSQAAERDLPAELLEMVAWYATEDPDPEREMWREEAWGGTPYYGGEPFSAGMSSTRGRAALGLFVRLCDTEDDALLGTDFVEGFLRYATTTHFAELEPNLKRMLASEDRDAIAAGARQACVAALEIEEAKPLAEACLKGDETRRAAAAEIFAAHLRTARYRSVCEEGLTALFDYDNEEVRRQAARCFLTFRDGELGDYRGFIRTFVYSRAFDTEHDELLDALQRTTAHMPEETCLACERFLEVAGEDAANIQLRSAGDADTALQVLVRAYNQVKDPALQSRCLDLFDRMAKLGIYQVIGTLERYER